MKREFKATPSSVEGRLLQLVFEGRTPEARELFGDVVRVNDPSVGRVEGDKEFENYILEFQNMFLADELQIRFGRVVAAQSNSVTEFELLRTADREQIRIWGAIVADLRDPTLDAVRIYYKRVLINGLETNRRLPILTDERPDIEILPTVSEYIEALKSHDVERCVALFEEDGRFWANGDELFEGRERLRQLYSRVFDRRIHGVFLEHPNAFTDGSINCVEFNSIRQAGRPGHAGVALYEVEPSGRLQSAVALDEP